MKFAGIFSAALFVLILAFAGCQKNMDIPTGVDSDGISSLSRAERAVFLRTGGRPDRPFRNPGSEAGIPRPAAPLPAPGLQTLSRSLRRP